MNKANEILSTSLEAVQSRFHRRDDGLLHVSSHLTAPLRHIQLEFSNVPMKRDLVDSLRLVTGTLWHVALSDALARSDFVVLLDTKVDEGLPKGWSGKLDCAVLNNGLWEIMDFKTARGEKIKFLLDDEGGVQEEHLYQVSAYRHALANMLGNVSEIVHVCYIPLNRIPDKALGTYVYSGKALPKSHIWSLMSKKADGLHEYLAQKASLASIPERSQKLFRNKLGGYDLKLVPHWTSKYCPFTDKDCGCRNQSTNKIGEFRRKQIKDLAMWAYYPRKEYAHIEPEVFPSEEC